MKWNQFHTETRMSLQWFFVRLPNDLTSIVLWFQKMQAVRVGDALETLQSLLTTLTLTWLTSHCSLLSRKRICRSGSSGSAMRRVWVAWLGATQTSVDTFVSPAGAKTNYWKKSWVNLSHVEMHRGRKRFDFLFLGDFWRFLCLFHQVHCLLRAVQTNKPVLDDFTSHPVGAKKEAAKVFFVSAESLKRRRCEIADC